MTKRLAALAALGVLALSLPLAAARADDNSYDDPSVHYAAPDGWTRIEIPPSDDAPVAAWQKQFDRYDARAITLKIAKWSGSLDGLETNHESETRSQGQNVFVDKKKKITMPNGMPAWQVRYSFGADAGQIVRDMEYVVYDGRRSVILSYVGRAGAFDDKAALDALSTLTVVLYPEGR